MINTPVVLCAGKDGSSQSRLKNFGKVTAGDVEACVSQCNTLETCKIARLSSAGWCQVYDQYSGHYSITIDCATYCSSILKYPIQKTEFIVYKDSTSPVIIFDGTDTNNYVIECV